MAREDRWIPTTCGLCYSFCSVRVHRVDGTVVKIEGNPESATTRGRLCVKGLSGIMTLYDPSRINVPLKRTNPQKGLDIDPGWVQITWEEALDTIAARLKKIRQEDPRKLLVTLSVTNQDEGPIAGLFATAFGTSNFWLSGAGSHCGNAEHIFAALLNAAWCKQPDSDYCRYLLNFGAATGFGAYYCATGMAQRIADARLHGLKHIVIDPFLSPTAEKADEWIPIRPGTDAAFALAMLYVLLHELNLYDADYLKHHTNGPYLIGENGLYLRDLSQGCPLVWDPREGKAKPFNDPSLHDFALEGEFQVNGARARPAFALLKEQLRSFPPEWAEPITTVPAATIRRLAREFGEEARIGSTIVVEGKVLPYRPVAVMYFKGAQGHKNALLNCMALELLVEVVGASNVPGGLLAINACSLGYPKTDRPRWIPKADRDGLLVPEDWHWPDQYPPPYPPREVRAPEGVELKELIPTVVGSSAVLPIVMAAPERFRVPYNIEMNLHVGANYVMTFADPKVVEKAFQNVFQVSFSLFLDESTYFSDIVLPDTSYLERLSHNTDTTHSHPPVGEWCYHLRQPVVEPVAQRRSACEVVLELVERLEMRKEFYALANLKLKSEPPYALDPARRYTWEEIVDRRYKNLFGEEHGLAWFKEHGLIKWPKKVEEVYWKSFSQARVPIYFEWFTPLGEKVQDVAQKLGIELDTSAFQPLPEWRPCRSHQETGPDYDLYAVYYKFPTQTASATYNNPWLDEVCRIDRFAYRVAINAKTARRKGIAQGDWIEITSAATGHTIRGRAAPTEGIHPEVIAIAGCGGHWSKHLPIANQEAKGLCFEWLMSGGLDNVDIPSQTQDLCAKVRVAKALVRP